MEPAKLLLLAIALLGIILIVLIVYLLASGPNGRKSKGRPQPEAQRRQDMLKRLQAEQQQSQREPPSHIPGMDTVNQRIDSAPADTLRPARPTDVTPPAGLTTSARPRRAGLDDRTPAGGTSFVAKSPSTDPLADTAPQRQISPAKPSIAPPSISPPPRPAPRKRKHGTVAMSSGFFAEEREARQAEKAAGPTPDPIDEAAKGPSFTGHSRDTPVASSAAYTGTAAPRVSPTPRPAPTSQPSRQPAASSLRATPATATVPVQPDTAESREDTQIQRFRDHALSTTERLDAFKQLLQSAGTDENVLYLVEGINSDVMEIQLLSLQEITARGDDSLLDEVIPLVESAEPNVALGAITALENIGGPVVEQTLLMALESSTPSVRERALQALIDNATPSLQAQLHDMLQDDEEGSVEIAAKLLGEFGGPQNAELLEVKASMLPADAPVRQTVTDAAAKAKTRDSSRATGSHDPFGGAEDITSSGGIEEFELSLDPEIFNPKS